MRRRRRSPPAPAKCGCQRCGLCVHLSPNLQEEEALRGLLDQLLGDVLGEEPGPELNQQRVVPLHVLRCHLGAAAPPRRDRRMKRESLIRLRWRGSKILHVQGNKVKSPSDEEAQHELLSLFLRPKHSPSPLLTLLLSFSQVEKPLLSWYCSPKNQVSLSPMVLTI